MDDKISFREKIFLGVCFLYILYTIFPLFADISGIPVYLPSILLVSVVLILYPKVLGTRVFMWFCVYVLVLILYILLGKSFHINGLEQTLSPWYRLVVESAWILPAVLIGGVLVQLNSTRLYRIISYGCIVIYLASFFYVLPLLDADSHFLREEGYDLMHSYALLIFPVCLCVKKSYRLRRVGWLGILMIFAYMVIRTAITTGLFVALFSIIVVMLYNPRKRMRTIFSFASLAILIFVMDSFDAFVGLIDVVRPYFEETPVAYKLDDIRESILRNHLIGDTLTVRLDFHEMSRNAFFRNPIFGSDGVGGHSKVLDLAGSAGLVGFIPYLMMIISMLKAYMRAAKSSESGSYVVISFLLAGVYLYSKGIFGSPGYLSMMVIVPSIIMSMDSKEHTDKV